MPDAHRPETPDRFAPRAHREMAGMFDAVTPRYELLNSLMTLGQDRMWRASLARTVPESAVVVVDLCTGNGDSLPGLRRPGRTVVGIDVSLGMLKDATQWRTIGWGPRLVCADAFHLPLPDESVDAITIAFGIRNLRPRPQAVAEIARVLIPGGTLGILEATAPAGGPFAPIHRLHLKYVVPLVGRLSPDPSAYRYLSQSIFEFGSGQELERDLAAAGFSTAERRSFLLGATRLWSVQRRPAAGQIAAIRPPGVQDAIGSKGPEAVARTWRSRIDTEWRVWGATQLVLALALGVALAYSAVLLVKLGSRLPFDVWQRRLGWFLVVAGLVFVAGRILYLIPRLFGPAPRR
jgi:demethylmenaquinone methyltransferase/2-methoxy-6-polyprenyl-1,4-benzoquinol methylase